jgi:hypothetical protein
VFESLTNKLISKGSKINQAPTKETKEADDAEPTPSEGSSNAAMNLKSANYLIIL